MDETHQASEHGDTKRYRTERTWVFLMFVSSLLAVLLEPSAYWILLCPLLVFLSVRGMERARRRGLFDPANRLTFAQVVRRPRTYIILGAGVVFAPLFWLFLDWLIGGPKLP